MAAQAPGHAAQRGGYRAAVTLLLMLAYAFNAADRSLIPVIAQPLKADLRLSDTELGLLAGTAFAVLYALCGIPIARLAERANRVTIISVALGGWSALTALCATAGSFLQLALLRVGIGIGEAGCAAPAQSLLSDYYDRTRRTSALSVYSCGLSLGYLFVSAVGSYVAQHHGWRAACVVIGLPGVAVAALIRHVVREPRRGTADGAAAAAAPAPPSLRGELAELGAVARGLFLSWPSAQIIFALTLSSFASYGTWAFIPAYFNRAFGLHLATIGVFLGLAGSVPVALGTLGGGFVADFAGARSQRWYALVPAAGLALAAPLYVLAFLQHDWAAAMLLLAAGGFFQYISLGPSFGVVQNVVGVRQRATATALLYLCLTLLALAAGPPFIGWLIDTLAGAHLAQPAGSLLNDLMAASPAGTAQFRAACPGQAMNHGVCAAALAAASRDGLLLGVTLHLWAAAHYVLGSLGLAQQMRRAAAG